MDLTEHANRWRDRAEELRQIADTMHHKGEDAPREQLLKLADDYERMAARIGGPRLLQG